MTTFTPEQKLTAIKHLAAGKSADVVANIMSTTAAAIIDLARGHGYPDIDKLAWAADILEKNIEKAAELPEKPLATGGVISRPQRPAAVTDRPEAVVKQDEWRTLVAAAKGHPSKRIQAAANKAIDALDKLRDLIREDQERNAERRAAEAARAVAKAEVERLEAALKAAKAKLKGSGNTVPASPAAPKTASNFRTTAPQGEYPCRNEGCDQVISTPQGRGLHERQHCAHRPGFQEAS